MGFCELGIARQYRSSEQDYVKDFLLPVLNETTVYKRAVGFFSTTALIDLSNGLTGMAKRGGSIQIVCSPRLSEEDLEAINTGYRKREEIITKVLENAIEDPVTEFGEERLNLIATLIAHGTLEMKLAFLEDDNGIDIYHEKLALFYDADGNKIGFNGSMNDSANAYKNNFESVFVFKSWNEEQNEYVEELESNFERLWDDTTSKVKVVPFPKVIIDKLKTFQKGPIDYDLDYKQYGSYKGYMKEDFLKLPEGNLLRDYQLEAITNWKEHQYRGIFDMATGTGKTYTALGAISRLGEEVDGKLAVLIVCPYIHLVGQWEEDVVKWGMHPIIAHSQSTTRNWKQKLINAFKVFRNKGKPFICITTNATYCDKDIQTILQAVTEDMNFLLVVDEAHNFGAERISHLLHEQIRYRLALSATIERHMDEEGTERIFRYFGERCITYSLETAIANGNLVEYEYHPVYAFLSQSEFQQYRKLTRQIRNCVEMENGKQVINEAGQMLLFKRSRLLAGAGSKIEVLRDLLEDYRREKYILVYCGATNVEIEESSAEDPKIEKQIRYITKMMNQELDIATHQFTSEENLKERNLIKECFADGDYQAITAIRCLDEGVNIPDIRTAFILASSRNPKEFIQRRGRLLRTAPGKDKAVIYDFVTLPRRFDEIVFGDFEEDRSIVLGEMARIYEFGRLAMNRLEADHVLDELQDVYGVTIDIEDYMQMEEDYYE